MEALKLRDHAHPTLASGTEENSTATIISVIDGRERIKIEFYKTYDVMTGIRIAATLGGFFSMMILLVLYKNYCKPSKTLSEEQLNAAVTAAVEEEDRALQAALEATSFYTSLEKRRQSLGSNNPGLCSPRFSSVGGGYSHLAPPVRLPFLQQRGKSLAGSALRFASNPSPLADENDGKDGEYSEEEDFDIEGQLPDYCVYGNYLSVPADRRLSSITCSSADSFYLERRGSAFEMGLPAPPPFVRHEREKHFSRIEEPWDFYYPIDIQVIQPTPQISPATSERTLYEEPINNYGLQVPGFQDRMHRLSVDRSDIGLAPLASISSLGSFSSTSSPILARRNNNSHKEEGNQGCSCHEDSVGSDSVFMDEMDTEDEVDEFSTDSEFDYDGFDDDYSFCESGQARPVSRCEKRMLQFASFDSYDASIARDSVSDAKDETSSKAVNEPTKRALLRQYSTDLRRHPSIQEGNKVKRRLVKTHSEPRSRKMTKLPQWVERGRSGYVPKRQLSAPTSKRKPQPEAEDKFRTRPATEEQKERNQETKRKTEVVAEGEQDGGDKSPLPLPSSSSSDSITITPSVQILGDSSIQGLNKDMPFKRTLHMSLHSPTGKRTKFQKQSTVPEETTTSSSNFLSPGGFLKPDVQISGSCEKLTNPNLGQVCSLGIPKIQIDVGSCEKLNLTERSDEHTEVLISRTSSQETIC